MEEERADAVGVLADLVANAYDADGANLGQALREQGGVHVLAKGLSDESAEVSQQSLFVLGNLCSDAVDCKVRRPVVHASP